MLRATRLVSGCSACCRASSAKLTTARLLGKPDRGAFKWTSSVARQLSRATIQQARTQKKPDRNDLRGDHKTFDCIKSTLDYVQMGDSSVRRASPQAQFPNSFKPPRQFSPRCVTNTIIPLDFARADVGRRDGNDRTGHRKIGVTTHLLPVGSTQVGGRFNLIRNTGRGCPREFERRLSPSLSRERDAIP